MQRAVAILLPLLVVLMVSGVADARLRRYNATKEVNRHNHTSKTPPPEFPLDRPYDQTDRWVPSAPTASSSSSSSSSSPPPASSASNSSSASGIEDTRIDMGDSTATANNSTDTSSSSSSPSQKSSASKPTKNNNYNKNTSSHAKHQNQPDQSQVVKQELNKVEKEIKKLNNEANQMHLFGDAKKLDTKSYKHSDVSSPVNTTKIHTEVEDLRRMTRLYVAELFRQNNEVLLTEQEKIRMSIRGALEELKNSLKTPLSIIQKQRKEKTMRSNTARRLAEKNAGSTRPSLALMDESSPSNVHPHPHSHFDDFMEELKAFRNAQILASNIDPVAYAAADLDTSGASTD